MGIEEVITPHYKRSISLSAAEIFGAGQFIGTLALCLGTSLPLAAADGRAKNPCVEIVLR